MAVPKNVAHLDVSDMAGGGFTVWKSQLPATGSMLDMNEV